MFQPLLEFYGHWFSEILLYLYRQRFQRIWRAVAIFPDRATDIGTQTPYQLWPKTCSVLL